MTTYVFDEPQEYVWDDEPHQAATALPPQTSLADQLLRQLGLTGRYLVEGAVSIPGLVYNPMTALVNLATGAKNPTLEAMASNIMDKLGAPKPQGPTERIVGDAARAMSGALTTLGAGMTAPAPWRQLLTDNPATQGLSAAMGAMASGFGREEGLSPMAQVGLGLVGSIAGNVPSAAIGTAKGTARTAQAIGRVATEKGREKVAGQILYELVTKPDKTIQRLKHAPITVPGSKPTSGGLEPAFAPLERMLHGTPPYNARLAERYAAQNAARVALMNKLTHAGVDLDVLQENMSKSALRYLRESEAQAAGKSIDLRPVLNLIDQKLTGPAAKEGASNQALLKVKQLLFVGNDATSGVLEDTFPMVYGIRKGISQILAGKNPDVPGGPAARRELMEVMNALDEQIKPVAPSFKRWLAEWARKSERIERIETLRDIQNRTMSSRVQVYNDEPVRTIEPGQWHHHVNRRISELGKKLTLGQISGLKRISADLERASIVSRGNLAVGSNTWQNASTAYVIGSMINRKMADVPGMSTTTGHIFAWLIDLPQQDIMNLLTDAMLDPKLAAKLMAKATPRNVESVAEALKRRAIATGIGSGIAQATANK